MTVQEACRAVMKSSGTTQQMIADRAGFKNQSSVSMYLNSKSMRVGSLKEIMDACGYEIVVRSKDGKLPEYVIGEERKQEDSAIRDMVKKIVAEELEKAINVNVATEVPAK